MTCLCCQLFFWGNDVCFYSSIGSLKAHTRRERAAVAVLARPPPSHPKTWSHLCVVWQLTKLTLSWQISECWSQPPQSLSSLTRSLHRECVALWKSRRKWKREREGNGWYFSRWWNLLRFIMMVSSPTWYGFVTHAMVWYWQMPQILFLSRLSDFAVVNTCCCTKICSEEEIACFV